MVYLDASLTGLGGQYGSMVYALPISDKFQDYDIVHLEMVNLIEAAKYGLIIGSFATTLLSKSLIQEKPEIWSLQHVLGTYG